jgi:hypothetical protein
MAEGRFRLGAVFPTTSTMNVTAVMPVRPSAPVALQKIVKGRSVPVVVGIRSVTMLAVFDVTVGAGDGQPSPFGVHSGGTGPIVVLLAVALPSSGHDAMEKSTVMSWPGAAWARFLQVRLNQTGHVMT